MQLLFKQITIIGIGHIGGSIGLALRQRGFEGRIVGVGRTERNLNIAKKRGCIDEIDSNDLRRTSESNLIILCSPVKTFPFWFQKIKGILKKNTLITDAGSVKLKPSASAKVAGISENYIPAHPIAGRETSGAASADADLFKNKICILTPYDDSKRYFIQKIAGFWKFIGCKIIIMRPSIHDLILAYTSHLPHVIAYATTGLIRRQFREKNIIFGGGLRDFTRIAGSSPEMWHDIFIENKKNILKAINNLKKEISKIESYIKYEDSKQLINYLKRSKSFRDKLFSD